MVYEGQVTTLQPNEVFVFGSNTQGRHGKGAALIARQKFGAIYGQARGPQGQSYAIVTKDLTKDYSLPSVDKKDIEKEIIDLYLYALKRPDIKFYVAYSGTGTNLNNYSNQEMADLFNQPMIPDNIVFEKSFERLVNT